MAPRSARPRSDHDLGIHTTRAVPIEGLELPASLAPHAHRYEPTPFGVLDELLAGLALDYQRTTFVDLGSGKGRVVCLAAGDPWKAVVGVEASPALHRIALENAAALPASRRRARRIQLILGDAGDYAFPREPAVIFLFNPFGPSVLTRVRDNLERALAEDQEERHLLYYMPVHAEVFDRSPSLELHAAERDWRIYERR